MLSLLILLTSCMSDSSRSPDDPSPTDTAKHGSADDRLSMVASEIYTFARKHGRLPSGYDEIRNACIDPTLPLNALPDEHYRWEDITDSGEPASLRRLRVVQVRNGVITAWSEWWVDLSPLKESWSVEYVRSGDSKEYLPTETPLNIASLYAGIVWRHAQKTGVWTTDVAKLKDDAEFPLLAQSSLFKTALVELRPDSTNPTQIAVRFEAQDKVYVFPTAGPTEGGARNEDR